MSIPVRNSKEIQRRGRQVKRAAGLWLISALFFVLESGIRYPDVFISSGILCTIALAILLTGFLLILPPSKASLTLVLIAGVLIFVLLDAKNIHVFPWIAGNSPLLPLCLFTFAGAIWGKLRQEFRYSIPWIATILFVLSVGITWHYGHESLFNYGLGRMDVTRILPPPLTGGVAKTVGYYNLKPLLSLVCLGFHLGLLHLFSLLFSSMKEFLARLIFAMGRHSLEIYVLHLTMLALLVVIFGFHPLKTNGMGCLTLVTVILICWTWAFLREKQNFVRPIG